MLNFVQRQPKVLLVLESLLLLFAVGWIDLITGYEVSLVLFYGVPICFAAAFCDRRTPFFIAALACVIWCWADFAAGHRYFSASVHAWEISVRGAFFFAVAVAAIAINDREKASNARFVFSERARKLEHQIAKITEYEQQRVGRELHDGLSQYLAAVSCAMTSLKIDSERSGSAVLTSKAIEIEKLLTESVNQARDLARSLAPIHQHEAGLAAALQELIASTSRRVAVDCSFEAEGEDFVNDNSVATYLYRIAQEAVDNAVKHGKATAIDVRLSANSDVISLSVTDDGIGFSRTTKNLEGIGISVMDYRASILGGELVIEETASGGTVVSCTVPTNSQRLHEAALC